MGPDARVQKELAPGLTTSLASVYESRQMPDSPTFSAKFDASLQRSEARRAKV